MKAMLLAALTAGVIGGAVAYTPADPPPVRGSLLVTPGWLALRLADPALVVLHVARDSAEYHAAHVPGARFVPLGALVLDRDSVPNELPPPERLDSVLEAAGVSTESRIVVYGDPLPAARLFFTLDYLGLGDRAGLLDGGLELWKAEGLPVSALPWEGPAGRLDWTLRPEVVVDAAWVADRIGDPSTALLDARPAADFSPHIPGATSLPWRTLLTAPEPVRLKDPAILARLFRRAGLDEAKTVVVYCRTGMQASYLYFAARYMGYAPRLYDGSFADWNRRTGVPIAP
ncbi:MAG TPA: rhodanese-like domain-containing protein [Gemmatimonadales bacterium]